MTVYRHNVTIPRLPKESLDDWINLPSAVVSDCLNRSQAMAGTISPLASSMRIVAQARTVECMVADNSALHGAIGLCEPGEVLVCNGQGFEDAALFGGLMTRSAIDLGVAGLVIDGAVRDSREIIEAGFPCFARAVVPGGPHKGFGGVVDGPINCGGVAVFPGDLVIGDADGVTVVPFARIAETLQAAYAVISREEQVLVKLAEGGSLSKIYGVPEVELIQESVRE